MDFQNYLGNTIPELIVQLLFRAGYDNAFSILDIDESDLKLIEEHAEQKSQDLLLKSGTYSEVKPFRFLPGHKKLIYSLPKKIHGFKNKRCRKNLFNIPEVQAQVQTLAEETIELDSESEIAKLKENLLSKLNKSASVVNSNVDLNIIFTEAELTAVEQYISNSIKVGRKASKPSYKCMVKCVMCEKNIPCTYNSYWQTSNLEKHFKLHIEEKKKGFQIAANVTEKNDHDQNTNENNSAEIQHIVNVNELNALLGLSDTASNSS